MSSMILGIFIILPSALISHMPLPVAIAAEKIYSSYLSKCSGNLHSPPVPRAGEIFHLRPTRTAHYHSHLFLPRYDVRARRTTSSEKWVLTHALYLGMELSDIGGSLVRKIQNPPHIQPSRAFSCIFGNLCYTIFGTHLRKPVEIGDNPPWPKQYWCDLLEK